MLLTDFVSMMERIAPPELACDFDNPGLLIGPEKNEIKNVLVALDATMEVACEAAEMGADLVLTHHPLFFRPVSRILPDDPLTASAYRLIRHGIGLYAAHTNLDSAEGGVNDTLCALFGLTDVIPYDGAIGRIGTLPAPMPLDAFVRLVEQTLGTKVRFAGEPGRTVSRVAVLGGAGGDSYAVAFASGADVLLTGEMKHNQAVEARSLGLAAVVAGHYETERIVLPRLIARLQGESDDVQYSVTRSEVAPFAQLKEG